jgi:hypothetical protein
MRRSIHALGRPALVLGSLVSSILVLRLHGLSYAIDTRTTPFHQFKYNFETVPNTSHADAVVMDCSVVVVLQQLAHPIGTQPCFALHCPRGAGRGSVVVLQGNILRRPQMKFMMFRLSQVAPSHFPARLPHILAFNKPVTHPRTHQVIRGTHP